MRASLRGCTSPFAACPSANWWRHCGPAAIRSACWTRRRPTSADSVTRLRNPPAERLDATLAWLAEPSHQLVTWDDQDYPNALLEIDEAPPVLFYLGRRELLNRPALAIVGSRHASPQGRDDARAFARTLAAAGVTIVSGLAVGIDAAAHEGALRETGSTLAVVGTGLDRVYPAVSVGACRRRTRRPAVRIRARIACRQVSLPTAQPPDLGPCARRAGRRSDAFIGFADYRPPGRRPGPRSDGVAGFHPLAAFAGLPQADTRGCQTGRNSAGCAGGTEDRCT